MFTKTHLRLLTVLLLSMLLASVACSKGDQKSQTADTKAAMHEQSEHDHTAMTESGSESDAWNKICPVCGGEVSADMKTVTYEGKVYGFGCAGCPEKFEENPQDYVKNLNEDGTEFIGG